MSQPPAPQPPARPGPTAGPAHTAPRSAPELPLETGRLRSFDGTGLAWSAMGAGPPVVLVHGLYSNAHTNWIRFGHAARIASAGVRVVMPDLRGHGGSDRPDTAQPWPADVLARDLEALAAALGLEPDGFDLGGYSLGARAVVRAVVRGLRPRRAILAGMGLDGVLAGARRAGFFGRVIDGAGRHPPGSPERFAEQFARSTGADLAAARPLLASGADTPLPALAAAFTMPTLVVCGADDRDNGSAEALAAALPGGRYLAIPGNHTTAVTRPALGEAIAAFLTAP
jgi:pimeloyl-ACP methyl ester carboxylesterase